MRFLESSCGSSVWGFGVLGLGRKRAEPATYFCDHARVSRQSLLDKKSLLPLVNFGGKRERILKQVPGLGFRV